MKKVFCYALIVLLSAAATAFSVSETRAAGGAQAFYKGKNLKFMVPFRPGGGFDTYARALTPFLKKHAGVRNVVIINKPGAGGNIAYNELYNAVKPDGLTITLAQADTLAFNSLWGLPEAKYEPARFSFLGRVVWEEGVTLLGTRSPYKSVEDLKKADVVKTACAGTGNDKAGTAASVTFNALGLTNLKKVVGYGGSREAMAAVLKGEADIASGYSVSGILRFVKAGKLVPLWIEGTERHFGLPDTPTIFELDIAKGREKPLNLYVQALTLGRTIIAPPGVPAERLRFFSNAVAQSINDPGYGASLKKMRRPKPRFLEGDKTRALMQKIVEISEEEKRELKQVVFEGGIR